MDEQWLCNALLHFCVSVMMTMMMMMSPML